MKAILFLALSIAPLVAVPAHAASGVQDFPDPGHAWLKEGSFAPPAAIREIQPGVTKRQVYKLVGEPHFSEGLGPRYWNYLFNIRTTSAEFVTCQLRMHFEAGKVDEMAWKRPECADLIKDLPQAVNTPVAVVVPGKAPIETADIPYAQYSVQFDFNSDALNPAARATIAEAVARARSDTPRKIIVVGATDSVGSDDYNLLLSKHRAGAVTAALGSALNRSIEMTVAGSGKDSQAVRTPDGVRQANNRRAVITFVH